MSEDTLPPEDINDVRFSGRVMADAQAERFINSATRKLEWSTLFTVAQRHVKGTTSSVVHLCFCVVIGPLQTPALKEVKAGMELLVNGELMSPGGMQMKVRVVSWRPWTASVEEVGGRKSEGEKLG